MTAENKPTEVYFAEIALWVWTVWTCISGIYQAPKQIAEIQNAISSFGEDVMPFNPADMLHMATTGYVVLAMISAWVIMRLSHGKRWARSTTLWGFFIQLGVQVCVMLIMPYTSTLEYIGDIGDIPDLGLQIVALHFLYSKESSDWFNRS